jgi:hypothetical protein
MCRRSLLRERHAPAAVGKLAWSCSARLPRGQGANPPSPNRSSGCRATALSAKLNARLAHMLPGKDRARSWLTLFKEIDVDGSGLITYDELVSVIRTKLKVPRADLAEVRIKSLWIALDADSGGQITSAECAPASARSQSRMPAATCTWWCVSASRPLLSVRRPQIWPLHADAFARREASKEKAARGEGASACTLEDEGLRPRQTAAAGGQPAAGCLSRGVAAQSWCVAACCRSPSRPLLHGFAMAPEESTKQAEDRAGSHVASPFAESHPRFRPRLAWHGAPHGDLSDFSYPGHRQSSAGVAAGRH